MADMLAAGGWLMLPIAICSILGFAIVIERAWALRAFQIAPPHLIEQREQLARSPGLSATDRQALEQHSPLGRIWAAWWLRAQKHPTPAVSVSRRPAVRPRTPCRAI